ncbi:MAG: hypothetical protein ACRDIB_14070 [Ardenticatenaceae bacterium]
MADLDTTLAVWRPSRRWTILFRHDPYAPALWALLFDARETIRASEHFGAEWPRRSAQAVVADHMIGYRTSVGQARERLVARLEPLRAFAEAWRAFSLTRALALSLAGIPPDWPLFFDGSAATLRQGGRYAELMALAVETAGRLAGDPPRSDASALDALLTMAHGMNPETALRVPESSENPSLDMGWPREGASVSRALLGIPVDCPTSYVEAMTRARRRWEARW